MEDLYESVIGECNENVDQKIPTIVQYGVKVSFQVAVVGQTDSGKTHSIMKCWLGGKIPYWKYVDDKLTAVELQHCLYCSNGGMSTEEKKKLRSEFIDKSLKNLKDCST